MNIKSVWVVVGDTREFSDWTTWNVAAYLDKEQAEQHAQLARAYAAKVVADFEDTWDFVWAEEQTGQNPYDKEEINHHSDTRYTVQELKLLLHVDQYIEERGG